MITILTGDALQNLRTLPDQSVQCCVTSPPYWGLRDYGVAGQMGLDRTPEEYVTRMVEVFREVHRVLRDDGTLWVNIGDSYARNGGEQGGGNRELIHMAETQKRMCNIPNNTGLKPKDLVGIPWMLAFALRADGWYLRSDIIWHKPNPMPESVTDRPTKAHEYLFLFSKSERYHYNSEAIKEPVSGTAAPRMSKAAVMEIETNRAAGMAPVASNPNGHGRNPKAVIPQFRTASTSTLKVAASLLVSSRNKRDVWSVQSAPYSEAHFATYPPDLIKPCILAGCPVGGTVLDPFAGSGTTGMVALELGRRAILIELNPDYITLIKQRCDVTPGLPL